MYWAPKNWPWIVTVQPELLISCIRNNKFRDVYSPSRPVFTSLIRKGRSFRPPVEYSSIVARVPSIVFVSGNVLSRLKSRANLFGTYEILPLRTLHFKRPQVSKIAQPLQPHGQLSVRAHHPVSVLSLISLLAADRSSTYKESESWPL